MQDGIEDEGPGASCNCNENHRHKALRRPRVHIPVAGWEIEIGNGKPQIIRNENSVYT